MFRFIIATGHVISSIKMSKRQSSILNEIKIPVKYVRNTFKYVMVVKRKPHLIALI